MKPRLVNKRFKIVDKKVTLVDKSGRWWSKTETNWVTKDKEGDWWLFRGPDLSEDELETGNRKNGPSSLPRSREKLFLIILCALLGVSLAFNLVYYLTCSG